MAADAQTVSDTKPMKKNLVIGAEALLLILLCIALLTSRRGRDTRPETASRQAGSSPGKLGDEQLISTARSHVLESPRYNDRYMEFLKKHGSRDLLDPTKPDNGVKVSETHREVTFFHNGWVYDGPRLEIVVTIRPDGSLIVISTREIPALGP